MTDEKYFQDSCLNCKRVILIKIEDRHKYIALCNECFERAFRIKKSGE